MVKQKLLDGTENLLAQGTGDTTLLLGPFLTIDGDWTIWVFLSDYFDCIKDEYIQSPKNCSACLNAVILNKICYDNGTSDPSDDYWTFDIIVTGGPGTYWTASSPVSTSGNYGVTKTIYPGLISNGAISFSIYDNEKPECNAKLIVEPPKPCSERCDLEVRTRISECIFETGHCVYNVTIDVSTLPGTCWMAKKKNPDGSEQILGTYYGSAQVTFGPFPEGEDWTLWVMTCGKFDCVRDFYIDAPECGGGKSSMVKDISSLFKFSPNPTNSFINITNQNRIKGTYKIISADGKLATKGFIDSETSIIDVRNFKTGTYFLEIIDSDSGKATFKFIKS